MRKDLHEKPFDEATLAKLKIFEDYAQAWLPTFIMYGEPVICLFDFFAGTGYDKNGVPGSPIRLLQKIKEQIDPIFEKGVQIKLYLNEYNAEKYLQLQSACDEFIEANPALKKAVELSLYNEDFEICFNQLLPFIQDYSSLVYLDQNGIQFLANKYLLALEKTKRTDFLYFVSSSYFWRFGESEAFKTHVTLDMEDIKKNPYTFIHRSLLEQLRSNLPEGTNLKLYPFSLKKGANIHGIIFGASHPRAVDKFLTIAWKLNPTNGEANFDIDEDQKKLQLELFSGKKLTKKEAFQERFRELVLSGIISNNAEAYEYSLKKGHLGAHAAEVLKQMKGEKLINFDGLSPLVTYENVYKKSSFISYIRL